jgi:hypothetical protein
LEGVMDRKRRFLCVIVAALCIPLLEASADRELEIIIVSQVPCACCWENPGGHNTNRSFHTLQATPNITDYAAWSISVNGAYAKRNGYAFYVDKSDGGDLVGHQRDVRWSKVGIPPGWLNQ